MSRTSISRVTRSGMLLIAPGWTRQTPVVATVSGLPLDGRLASTASTASAAAHRASRRPGIRTAPACPPSPFQVTRSAAGAAIAVTMPIGNAGPFEERALFDVQLDEGGEVSLGEPDVRQLALKPGRAADLVEREALRVSQRGHRLGRQASRQSARLPRQPMPNRVGSSLVNITSSIGRTGWNPAVRKVRIAASPPSTPTVPSNRPECGIASICEPVPTGASSGRSPSQRANVLPIGSSRTDRPASRHKLLDLGPRRQVGVGVEDAGHGRTRRVALGREGVELGHDPVDVHLGLRGRHAVSSIGSRFTSL